jgi:hypothetical protein
MDPAHGRGVYLLACAITFGLLLGGQRLLIGHQQDLLLDLLFEEASACTELTVAKHCRCSGKKLAGGI